MFRKISDKKESQGGFFRKFLSGFLLLFGAVLLAVVFRVCVFEIYSIPSGSMEATLVPGDRIVVVGSGARGADHRQGQSHPLVWELYAFQVGEGFEENRMILGSVVSMDPIVYYLNLSRKERGA